MAELELELKKGDVSVKIRGATINEILHQIDNALSLLEQVMEKLKEKKIEIPVTPTIPTVEVPHLGPPVPSSCRDAILRLLSTDWGRIPKTLGEIIQAMEINGVYYPKSSVASGLLSLTRSGVLRRLKTKVGFAYIQARPL